MNATKKIIDILIPAAYQLASECANDLPQQSQFAAMHLDSDQSAKFLDLCQRVRESRAAAAGQRLLDEVVLALTGKPNQ